MMAFFGNPDGDMVLPFANAADLMLSRDLWKMAAK